MFILGISVLLYFLFFRNKDDDIIFEIIRDPVILHVEVPRLNEKTPLASEQMFASLHGILKDSERSVDFLSFEFISDKATGINFYAVVPKYLFKFVEGQIYAQYPNANISEVEDYINKAPENVDPSSYRPYISTSEIEMAKDFVFPIKTFRDFEVDPLASITSTLADVEDGERIMVQVLVRPVANNWQEISKSYISAVQDGQDPTAKPRMGSGIFKTALSLVVGMLSIFFTVTPSDGKVVQKPTVKLLPGQDEEITQISDKMAKVGFEVAIRIVTKALSSDRADQLLENVIASFKQFSTANLNYFVRSETKKTGEELYDDYTKRFLSSETPDILSISEIASLYHLPNISVETPNISWSRAKKAEPPMDLPTEDANIFAETNYRGRRISFGIKPEDRPLHFYLLGKTGTGKSTVFKNMIISDILSGHGVGVIDPHGNLVEDILDYIPANRMEDVVYVDPSDMERPIGFNLLQLDNPDQRDLVADGVVEVFKKHFEYSWGPRLQYVLHNAILTALEVQGTTLLAIQRMLIDRNYRKFIVKQIKDPLLKKFWEEEFASMETNSRLVTEAVAPIQNKVGRFLSSATIRNIVGQVKSTIDLDDILNNGKIFLVNLSHGRMGEESSALFGGMLVTRLQAMAMERVNIPEADRKPFYLFVDEFQNYATESFSKILSEARKYKLCLHLTHQYLDQLPEEVRKAIFGNVGSFASFVVGPTDATLVGKEFSPTFTEEDLITLERHNMYIKLMIDGVVSQPFSARSLDVRYSPVGSKDKITALSREKYGMDRAIVEDKIKRWTNQEYSQKGNRSLAGKEENQRSSTNYPVRSDNRRPIHVPKMPPKTGPVSGSVSLQTVPKEENKVKE
ncbi:MAG: type IV secretion system DNA-binding domain-containing protein [bacterium]